MLDLGRIRRIIGGMNFDAIVLREAASARDRAGAEALLAAAGLAPEGPADLLLVAESDGRIVGTAALAGQVLQRIAVEPRFREADIGARLVGELVDRLAERGGGTPFIFTPPATAERFLPLGFRLLAEVPGDPGAALLEGGPRGFEDHFAPFPRPAPGERAAGLVMNCNPMTLGHLHLVETASLLVPHVFLFLVSADRSAFPAAARSRIVAAACSGLPNVTVVPTGPYQVSPVTFPSYFSRTAERATDLQTRLDVTLFATRLAPRFCIDRRLVGTEPYCPVTSRYNKAMAAILPAHGITLVEIPRLESGGEAVSASRVRALLVAGEFDAACALVPPATADYLRSSEGAAVIRRLAGRPGPH